MNSVSRWLITAWYRWRPIVPASDGDRGDVPGWVLITLMTATLVVVIWGIARGQLVSILNDAFTRISTVNE